MSTAKRLTPNKIANLVMADEAWHDSEYVAASDYDALSAELAALRAERDALRAAGKDALHALTSSRVFVTSRERCHHTDGTAWYDERVERLRAALGER